MQFRHNSYNTYPATKGHQSPKNQRAWNQHYLMFRVEGHRIIALEESFSQCRQSQLPLQHWSSSGLKKGRCTILLQRSNRLRFGWGFQDFKHQLTFRWGLFNIHSPLHVFGKSDNHLPKYQTAQTSWQEVDKSLDSLGVGLWNPRGIHDFQVWLHTNTSTSNKTVLDFLDPCRPGDAWEASQDIPGTKWDCHTSH